MGTPEVVGGPGSTKTQALAYSDRGSCVKEVKRLSLNAFPGFLKDGHYAQAQNSTES